MRNWGEGRAVNECMSEGMNDCLLLCPSPSLPLTKEGTRLPSQPHPYTLALSQVRGGVPSPFLDTLRVLPGGGALPQGCQETARSNQGRGTPSDVAPAR